MTTKKLEKVMSQKAVRGGPKKAGDKGAKESPDAAQSIAESNANAKKKLKKGKKGPANPAGEPKD